MRLLCISNPQIPHLSIYDTGKYMFIANGKSGKLLMNGLVKLVETNTVYTTNQFDSNNFTSGYGE